MKFKIYFLLIMLLFSGGVMAQTFNNDLSGLSLIQQGVKTKRVSSYDRSGDNRDNQQNIKSGEKRTLFDVKGVGMINHIWITMGPEPNVLSRNDVIIKMYWDGNDRPSVESPIGPFFGQGW